MSEQDQHPKPIVSRSYDLLGRKVEGEVVVRLPSPEWERLVDLDEQLEAAEREREEMFQGYQRELERSLGIEEQYEDLKRLASPTAMTVIAEKVDAELQVIRLKEQLEAAQREREELFQQYSRQLEHLKTVVQNETEALAEEQRLEEELRLLRIDASRAFFLAEHLFQMIPREVWRDQGGDDQQGHYEGDYYAEQTEQELRALRVSFPAVEEVILDAYGSNPAIRPPENVSYYVEDDEPDEQGRTAFRKAPSPALDPVEFVDEEYGRLREQFEALRRDFYEADRILNGLYFTGKWDVDRVERWIGRRIDEEDAGEASSPASEPSQEWVDEAWETSHPAMEPKP